MLKDKYRSIFSCQMEAIVFIILQIFFCNKCGFENWEYPRIISPGLAGEIFGHLTRLDQSNCFIRLLLLPEVFFC